MQASGDLFICRILEQSDHKSENEHNILIDRHICTLDNTIQTAVSDTFAIRSDSEVLLTKQAVTSYTKAFEVICMIQIKTNK